MPEDIPQLKDRRPKIAGLLPKNTQALVLGGIALVMMLVIAFSGRSAPKTKSVPASPASPPVAEPSQARIQEYRARLEEQTRKLAAEEAELAQTKAALAAPSGPVQNHEAPPQSPIDRGQPGNWVQRDREKREYQSLYASNIALTYRREAPEGVAAQAARATPTAAPSGSASATDPAKPEAPQYRLFEGTILETVLTNRLESSFSGPVNCMVTTSVYSRNGKLLVPQGSRVLGEAKKVESFGEQRLAVLFHRLIMPDGFSVSLDQFKALDQIGETGLRDEVNHHYLQVFGASIAIGALAGLSQATTRYGFDESGADAYRQGVASSLSQSALHILDRYLNVVPTFTVREGYRIKVYLAQDLLLPAYEAHPVREDF